MQPLGCIVNRSVVAIVGHIGRYEHPLWESGSIHISGKVIEVAVPRKTRWHGCHRIVDDRGVVLAHIVGIIRRRCIDVVLGGKTVVDGIRQSGVDTAWTHLKPSYPSKGMFS